MSKEIECNVCKNKHCVTIYENVKGHNIVKCLGCGLIYTFPQPTDAELKQYYSTTYYKPDINTDYLTLRRMAETKKHIQFLEQMKKFKRRGKLLDVGCSFGFFLEKAREDGWDVSGIEVGKPSANYAVQELGLRVYSGNIFDADYPDDSFDVVTMWHVLEHVPDPLGYLLEVNRILKEDGVVAIRTPNIESLSSWIWGKNWPWLKLVPDHLFHFSAKTLKNLLNKSGFYIVDLKTFRGDYPYNFLLSCLIGSCYRIGLAEIVKKNLQKENYGGVDLNPSDNVFSKYDRLIEVNKITDFTSKFFLPLIWLLEKLKLGDEIFIIGQKASQM